MYQSRVCAAQILVNIVADHNAVFGLDILLLQISSKYFRFGLQQPKFSYVVTSSKSSGETPAHSSLRLLQQTGKSDLLRQ